MFRVFHKTHADHIRQTFFHNNKLISPANLHRKFERFPFLEVMPNLVIGTCLAIQSPAVTIRGFENMIHL